MAGFGLPNFGQLTEAFKKAQQIQPVSYTHLRAHETGRSIQNSFKLYN